MRIQYDVPAAKCGMAVILGRYLKRGMAPPRVFRMARRMGFKYYIAQTCDGYLLQYIPTGADE